MLWVIICTDKPGTADLRNAHLDAHRKYLKGLEHRIFFSGPQMTDDGSQQIGSVFMVKADSREDALKFIEAEDLYRVGVFESVIVRRIRRGRLNVGLAE